MARYQEHYGCYAERILADKIYHSRQTLAFCKEHGIRLSDPTLGKPPKNLPLSRQAKKQKYQNSCDRNAVEGVFGTAKTAYGLGRIMARLQETAFCVIGVALLLLNLSRSLKAFLALFCLLSVVAFFWSCRVEPILMTRTRVFLCNASCFYIATDSTEAIQCLHGLCSDHKLSISIKYFHQCSLLIICQNRLPTYRFTSTEMEIFRGAGLDLLIFIEYLARQISKRITL